jgi:hypothetical protein
MDSGLLLVRIETGIFSAAVQHEEPADMAVR